MHTEPRPERFQTPAFADFQTYAKGLISPGKYKTFDKLLKFPLKSTEVTQVCFDKLSRVFDGRNPAMNYQFLKPDDRDDWEYYRTAVLKEPEIWQTEGWANFKNQINSILVVDLPRDPAPGLPEPYFYWLNFKNVKNFAINKKGLFEWIIYESGKADNGKDNLFTVVDDQHYRVFQESQSNPVLITESLHGLGFVPARFFWEEAISLSEKEIKQSPLTKVLGALDWYLFQSTSKKHLDLYAAYPIYTGYSQDCSYSDKEGRECKSGYIVNSDGHSAGGPNNPTLCPICSDSRLAGPGTAIWVDPPSSKDDPDLKDAIRLVGVDVPSLTYNTTEGERLEKDIIDKVIGIEGTAMSSEAINELQVNANFENQSTVLNRIKKGFESAWGFVDSTICKLRYGAGFVECSINLGTEFYLFSPEALRTKYKAAKEGGASETELIGIRRQLIETEYRHDKLQLQRSLMLLDLETLPTVSKAEAKDLLSAGIISATEFGLKLNFSSFVSKFERENTNILEFGINLPYAKRIDKIQLEFLKYEKARHIVEEVTKKSEEVEEESEDKKE